MSGRRGFTLIELVVALVLFGIVGTSIYQLLVTNQRLYLQQSEQVNTNQAARAAVSILPFAIRELSATDDAGSDVLATASTGFRYRAPRNLYFTCRDGVAGTITLDGRSWFGIRAIDVTTDSLLIFAENNPDTRTDDEWLHANVSAMATGTACPGGTASLALTISLASGAATGVLSGAPVRSYELEQVRVYQDASGDWWLGGQTISKSSGAASTIQPIIGPLADTGLTLTYYNSAGAVTTDRSAIARIGVNVTSQSRSAVRTGDGTIGFLLQDLATDVTLRNNCRYSC